MRAEQTVNEMAQVVLWRQARALSQRTGQSYASARAAVARATDAEVMVGEPVLGADAAQRRIGDYFAACMDVAAIDAAPVNAACGAAAGRSCAAWRA